MKISFLKLMLKNPFRNKSRAALSIVGIGIGILTIVTLGAMINGLLIGAEDSIFAGGSDFIVMGKNETGMDSSWSSTISKVEGVNSVVPVYNGMAYYDGQIIGITGIDSSNLNSLDVKVINGTEFTNGSKELVIGKLSSDQLNKTVGDTIVMDGDEWKIVGLFETGDPNLDSGLFSSLEEVQTLMDDEKNISGMYVKLDKNAELEEVRESIENKYGDNVSVIASLADSESSGQIIDMINGVKWGISLLAIVIGGIGIINTMIMSVYERTREIGVLKAVGWSSKRIVGMILGESIVITLTAGVVGSIVGYLLIVGVDSLNVLGGMHPSLTANLFLEAMVICLIVGIIGGLYPAIKASRLPPTEALRYE